MPRFKLRFDEFFKRMAVAFFELFGFRVTTEIEIFKLPKKADVIVVSTERLNIQAIETYFTVFGYFREHRESWKRRAACANVAWNLKSSQKTPT
ncbi:MAG: hypothetical protein HS115_14305 [Spirochaetales bacterium]|nr:hypothetical protein [Spirochaetales bacterium]